MKILGISKFDVDYDIERNCILERKFKVPDREKFGMEKSTYVKELNSQSGHGPNVWKIG